MAEDKPVDPAWVLGFGAVLLAILCLYLFLVSDWYWRCAAQIDRSTLAPVACKQADAASPAASPLAPGATPPFEQRTWPDFGAANDRYGDAARLWGDDVVSQFFAGIFSLAGRVADPFVAETVVPGWNRLMAPDFNRKALLAAVALVLGAMAKEWAKDVYRLLRRPKRDDPAR